MITREFLKTVQFRVMNESDKEGFAGVQSPVPMIGEVDNFLVIIDGDRCEVYGEDSDFGPADVCESISELEYA
jgi:hypothetical protein